MVATRHPTKAARTALAMRLGFPNNELMQDWEWQVADSSRLSDFFDAYASGQLTDDERFSLVEIIVQSVEDLQTEDAIDIAWTLLEPLLLANSALHESTVEYWARLDANAYDEMFRVSPRMRFVRERMKK